VARTVLASLPVVAAEVATVPDSAGEVDHFVKLESEVAWEVRNFLLRTAARAGLAALM